MSGMRVAVFVHGVAETLGGGFSFQRETLTALIRNQRRFRHKFVVLGADQTPPAALAGSGLDYLCYRLPRRNRAAAKMRRLAARTRMEVLELSQGEYVPEPVEQLLDANGVQFVWNLAPEFLTAEVPYMVPVWDLQHRLQPYFPEVSRQGAWAMRERMFSRMLQRAAFVIAGTEAGRDEIAGFYGVAPARIRILRHPTPDFALQPRPTETQCAAVLKKHGLSAGYLFYPAQLWPHKNHVNLFHALRSIRDRIKPTLVLAGSDKGQWGRLQDLAIQLGISEQVRWLGFVPQDDLPALYSSAAALVYPSFFGPENLPPLEAMGLGVPVLAARVSGAQEQLGDAALLFSPSDPREMAAAIVAVVNDASLSSRLAERGAGRARSFTSDDFVIGAVELLNEFEGIRRCW